MTTRQLTQEEIDNAPEWATHYQIYDNDKDICFESKDFYQIVLDGARKDNIIGLEDESIPIPGRETTTTTKAIEFKEGEILSALNVKMIQFGHLVPEDRYIYSQADKKFKFTKDCTITIEVK